MTLIDRIQANNEKIFFALLNLPVSSLKKKPIDEVDAECGGSALYLAVVCSHFHFTVLLLKIGISLILGAVVWDLGSQTLAVAEPNLGRSLMDRL